MVITIERKRLEELDACEEGLALFDGEAKGELELTREWTGDDADEFRRVHPDFWHWLIERHAGLQSATAPLAIAIRYPADTDGSLARGSDSDRRGKDLP